MIYRLPLWYLLFIILSLGYTYLGVIAQITVTSVIGIFILGTLYSYYEYQKIPKKINVKNHTLTFEEKDGARVKISDYAIRKVFWFRRIIFIKGRRVRTIPLEAYTDSKLMIEEL